MAFTDKLGEVFNKAKGGTIAVSLEAKKKMKESSIKGEISSLESKMNSVFTRIGKEAYDSFFETLYTDEKLRELMDSVKDLKDQIIGKEKELEESMAQFDKEIAEVKENAGLTSQASEAKNEEKAGAEPPPSESGRIFCTQCGAQNNIDSNFCNSCGAKLAK
jgi:replicative DNA helicase